MKKELIATYCIIFIILINACVKVSNKTNVTESDEIYNETTNITYAEKINLENCHRQECAEYCRQNSEECKEWCRQNPEACSEEFSQYEEGFPSGINPQECQINPKKCLEFCEKNPGVCPEEHLRNLRSAIGGLTDIISIIGPGGCRGPACQQYCQQNMEECQDWCSKNSDKLFCKLFSGDIMFLPIGEFSGTSEELVEPPKTIISFAKSVNVFEGQFNDEVASRAKDLGANMVTIWITRKLVNDEFIFFPERVITMINLAHKKGMQVELRSSYGIEEEIQNYEKFRKNALDYVAKLSKFSEKHKVYRIVPFGEIDNHLINYPNKIGELSKELLVEMRKHYSGKIGVGIAAPWRDTGFKFESYDYLTISAYPHNDLATSINWARKVADRSGISTLHIGETGVINPEDKISQNFETVVLSKKEEAEFYENLFEQFSGNVEGISVFYTALYTNFMSVYGDPAEQVVKEWYHKLYPEEKNQETKLIVANPLDLYQVVRISKFRSCMGHDYSGLNINREKEKLRSMKHYIEVPRQLVDSGNTVKVFAPFDGKVTEIIESGGKQVFISADAAPTWHFVFFHITPTSDIQVGTTLKAGQLIGQAYLSEGANFDIAFKRFGITGEIFDSPFMHMSDSIFNEYKLRGITLENIIIPKEFRDNNPCPVKGTKNGDAAFTGETENADFIILK